jgi:competence protein ComEC
VPRSAWLAIGATVAALASPGVGALPALLAGATFVLTALGLGQATRSWVRAWIAIAFGIGVVAVAARLWLVPAPIADVQVPGGDGPWTGVVVGVGSPRDGSQSVTVDLELDDGVARVAASLARYPDLVPGDRVEVSGSIRAPPEDGYGVYLRRIGAIGTLRGRSLERIAAAPAISVEAARRTAGDALQRAVPEPEAGLAAGILIGLRERVDRDLAADFTTAGVSHVVAISGWNIALVAGLIAGLLRGRGRRTRLVLIVVAISAYTIAAGASPSVLRAAVMAGIVLLARGLGRSGRAAAALGWAAAVLLLVEPGLVADAGFQLSVIATAGLLAWAAPITERLERLGGGRVPAWLAESLGVSLAAQAATLPLILASFGRLSLIAPVVNILVVPLVPLSMAAGVLALAGGALVLAGAPAVVGTIAGLPAWLTLTAIVQIVRVGAAVPLASVSVPPELSGAAGVAAASAIVVWALRRGRPSGMQRPDRGPATGDRTRRPAAANRSVALLVIALAAATTLSLGGLAIVERAGRGTILTVLDVGQGDAILLETREGSRLLVDGGPDPDRLLVALDERIPAWDRRIDVVLLSHPHEDHVAGLAMLLRRYAVHRVLEPGMRGPGPGWQAWDAILRNGGPRHGTIGSGGRLRLDEVSLEVLWPDRGSVPLEPADSGTGINNVSVVLLGEVAGRRFLLAGDIEEQIDPILLARGLPPVDVLKVAHHGSATASTDAFLDAVRPRIAIASAGAGNRYGHPAPSTLSRLRDRAARVLRTDRDGSVELRFDPAGIGISTSGPRTVAVAAPTAARPLAFQCTLPLPARPKTEIVNAQSMPVRRWDRGPDLERGDAYHRADDDPQSPRGCPAAPLAGSARVVRATRRGRGGSRGLAGPSRAGPTAQGGSRTRRGGRVAPRRGQAARDRPARARPPPWRGVCCVAGDVRGGGTRRARPGAPGDPPHRRRGRRSDPGRAARGPSRGLCRQARRPAARVDGCPVRLVAPPLPGRLGPRDRRPCPRASNGPRDSDLRGAWDPTRRRSAPAVGQPGDPCRTRRAGEGRVTVATRPALAHFRGDDDYTLGRAIDALADRIAAETGSPPERWRTSVGETTLDTIAERIATAPMFGGGTLAVIVDPAPLLRSKDGRKALEDAIGSLAPGNGLVFVESPPEGGKRSAALVMLEELVKAVGGEVREFRAPREGNLAAWIEQRATERGIALATGAAKELAERVGGFVREGDVDRRSQGTLAVAELEKLALYRPGTPVTQELVADLVPAVVPDSIWAVADAVGNRRAKDAAQLLDRLLDSTPEPVVLVILHRRIRELIELSDRLATGAPLPKAAMAMGIRSDFRAQTLARQARAWSLPELDDALEGLLDLDAMVKNAPDAVTSERQRRLAFALWVEERVGGGASR